MMLSRLPALLLAGNGLLFSGSLAASTKDIRSANVAPTGGQVIVDGGGIYMRATRLKDGSIIGGYAAQDGPNHVLRVVRSTNNGESWSAAGSVASDASATHDLDNADVVQLPSGRLLFAFRNHDRTSSGTYTYYRITICYSDDNGATWHFLNQLDERAAGADKNGLWEPFLRVSRNGTVQAFYSAENNGGDQDNLMKTSTDNGQTWRGPFPVSGQGITSRDGMTGVTEIDGNGNLICVFENTESGRFTIDSVVSHDDGFTWSSRRSVYAPPNNRNAGAPQVINVGGRLVTSFMEKDTTNVDGGEMKVVVSTDGGQAWSGPTVTGGQGSHWPGLLSLSSSEFLALYSINGNGLVSQKYQV